MGLHRWKRRGFIVLVNCVVFFVLVALLEVAASFFVQRMGMNIVYDYRLNHKWKPRARMLHEDWAEENPEFPDPYVHLYNDRGWIEEYDVDPQKPPGTFRIFYLGDSFIEGTVPMEQSVPSVVEKRLNELAQGSPIRFEVINTGTMSYSPTIYYVLIRYVLSDYSPDLIVLTVDMTDEFDDWKYSQTLVLDEEGNPWAVPPRNIYAASFLQTQHGTVKATPLARIQLFLCRRSYAYNFLLDRMGGRIRGNLPEQGAEDEYGMWGWCAPLWNATVDRNVGRTLDLLKRIAALCEERGIRLMITSVPHYWNYAGDLDGSLPPKWSSRPHEEIARLCQEMGIPYLNSFEELAPAVRGTPQHVYYYRGDIHFNPRGYALWSDAHARFLMDPAHRLLPEAAYGSVPEVRPVR